MNSSRRLSEIWGVFRDTLNVAGHTYSFPAREDVRLLGVILTRGGQDGLGRSKVDSIRGRGVFPE